jgi:hypothetical protein
MVMKTYEPELAAAVERLEAAQKSIERHAPDGPDLGPMYAELDAAVREYEVVVPKWRDAGQPR